MATTTKSNRSRDAKRVSSQKHEIGYAADKVKSAVGVKRPKAKKSVVKAKKALGRTTSRPKVMARAKKIAAKA